MTLPILNCDGCGICCRNQPSPPGYVLYYGCREHMHPADRERMDAMPRRPKRELQQYVGNLRNGLIDDEQPCIWLDPVTLKCRHYEHRPQVCRDFEMGGEDCQRMREEEVL